MHPGQLAGTIIRAGEGAGYELPWGEGRFRVWGGMDFFGF